jgi:hypothetical protein
MLDGSLSDKVHDPYRPMLSKTMYPPNTLFEHSGIPGQIHIDHGGSVLEVESNPASIGRKEDLTLGIVLKLFYQVLSFPAGNSAVK